MPASRIDGFGCTISDLRLTYWMAEGLTERGGQMLSRVLRQRQDHHVLALGIGLLVGAVAAGSMQKAAVAAFFLYRERVFHNPLTDLPLVQSRRRNFERRGASADHVKQGKPFAHD